MYLISKSVYVVIGITMARNRTVIGERDRYYKAKRLADAYRGHMYREICVHKLELGEPQYTTKGML